MSIGKATYINFEDGQRGSGGGKRNKYAMLSSIAYSPTLKEKRDLLSKWDKSGNWVIDPSLSSRHQTVFVSTKTKEVVVAVRGTDVLSKDTRWKDVKTDLGIAAGVSHLGKRYKSVAKIVDKAADKYDTKPVMSGHSLGGKIASDIARSKDLKGVIYNAGSSPVDVFAAIKRKLLGAKKPDIEHHNTNIGKRVDPVSISKRLLGDEKNMPVVGNQELNPHALDNFVDTEGQIGEGCSKSPWMKHVKAYRLEHPNRSFKECLSAASKTYKKEM